MEKIISYLTFRIGDGYYACSVSHVHNIIEYTPITKVPEMPSYMLGIINLRGSVLPVVDARLKLGLEATPVTGNTCILVLEVKLQNKTVFVGIMVDAVSEVIEIKTQEIKDTPEIGSKVKNENITGVFHDGNKFIMLLEMDRIFATKEVINIEIPEMQ